MNTVEHIEAMPSAVTVQLTKEEIKRIQDAAHFTPQFPVNFLFNYKGTQPYTTDLTASNNQQYQMAAWIQAPPRQQVRSINNVFKGVSDILCSLTIRNISKQTSEQQVLSESSAEV